MMYLQIHFKLRRANCLVAYQLLFSVIQLIKTESDTQKQTKKIQLHGQSRTQETR